MVEKLLLALLAAIALGSRGDRSGKIALDRAQVQPSDLLLASVKIAR
jgi:hypothetical protein